MSCIINASTSTGLVSSADLSGSLQIQTNSGNTAMTIDNSQNVGIGTTNPTGKLDVANRGITKGSMPAGSIIQVVNVVLSTVFSTTSSNVAVTGASVSITPTSSTSKILVIATGSLNKSGSGDAIMYLARNGTPIGNGSGGSGANGFVDASQSYAYGIFGGTTTVLDSPATTSAVTYALYVWNNNSNTIFVNGRGNPTDFALPSTITAMEIAQ